MLHENKQHKCSRKKELGKENPAIGPSIDLGASNPQPSARSSRGDSRG